VVLAVPESKTESRGLWTLSTEVNVADADVEIRTIGANRTPRHHADVLRGPTRGHHVNVWGYLVELIVESSVILTPEGGLRDDDAQRFGTRSVWPAITMREAFNHLGRKGLIVVKGLGGATPTAEVDLDGLTRLLQPDFETERLRAGDPEDPVDPKDIPVLSYFRSRRLYARHRWLDQILEVGRVE
jgi:hypothetical protein